LAALTVNYLEGYLRETCYRDSPINLPRHLISLMVYYNRCGLITTGANIAPRVPYPYLTAIIPREEYGTFKRLLKSLLPTVFIHSWKEDGSPVECASFVDCHIYPILANKYTEIEIVDTNPNNQMQLFSAIGSTLNIMNRMKQTHLRVNGVI
jgi:hypothetical protein